MQIKKAILANFIKKVVPLPASMTEILLNFTEEGITVTNVETRSRSLLLTGLLPSTKFTDYQAIGKIGLKNIKTVVGVINSFTTEEIKLTYNGTDLLTFSDTNDKKSINCKIVKPEYLKMFDTNIPFEYDEELEVASSKDFSTIIANHTLIGAENITLTINGSSLKVKLKSANNDFTLMDEIPLNKDCKKAKLVTTAFLTDVLAVIDEGFTIQYKGDVDGVEKSPAIKIIVKSDVPVSYYLALAV